MNWSFTDSDTSSTLRTFSLQGSPLLGDNRGRTKQLFEQLHMFEGLESLAFTGNGLKAIPAGAFHSESSNCLPNLTLLDLGSNAIESIGAFAFASLAKLDRIVLDNNKLDHLVNRSFVLKEAETEGDEEFEKAILIFLRNNLLNETSFEPLAFSSMGRDFVTLYLSSNRLAGFPAATFSPFLDTYGQSLIALWENPFKCDCRLSWLVENATASRDYQRRVHGLFCPPDEREVWDYSLQELNQVCHL